MPRGFMVVCAIQANFLFRNEFFRCRRAQSQSGMAVSILKARLEPSLPARFENFFKTVTAIR